jgi:Fic family protein
MYVRQEAVLSSQIEGTQSTLEDVLQFEADARGKDIPIDVEEVVNYVRAIDYGLKRLPQLPLSLRLIREIHAELLEGVRGAHRTAGEFRTSQNWIGPENPTIASATFVPPSPHEMHQALDNLEKFLHDTKSYPTLVHCGFASFLRPLFRQDWVVYSKPTFGGPEHVLRYLGRYTHRVAISNHRLVSLE